MNLNISPAAPTFVAYFHYAYVQDAANTPLKYRRGTPNSDGTITWSTTAEQTAVAAASGVTYSEPSVIVDSNGYPWIGYGRTDGSGRLAYVTKSKYNNGTFSPDTPNFPYQLSGFSASGWVTVPIPLTNGKMFCIYSSSGFQMKGRSWDGSNWNDERHTTDFQFGNDFSAVDQGDYVHLAQARPIGPIIKDKLIEFPGQMFFRHVFHLNGTVVVSDELRASLVIEGLELPFAHRTELNDYGNGTVAYRLSFTCLGGTYEVWEVFDFKARRSGVRIEFAVECQRTTKVMSIPLLSPRKNT